MKIPIFPGKYHQNGGFSMAMLVYRRVNVGEYSMHGSVIGQEIPSSTWRVGHTRSTAPMAKPVSGRSRHRGSASKKQRVRLIAQVPLVPFKGVI